MLVLRGMGCSSDHLRSGLIHGDRMMPTRIHNLIFLTYFLGWHIRLSMHFLDLHHCGSWCALPKPTQNRLPRHECGMVRCVISATFVPQDMWRRVTIINSSRSPCAHDATRVLDKALQDEVMPKMRQWNQIKTIPRDGNHGKIYRTPLFLPIRRVSQVDFPIHPAGTMRTATAVQSPWIPLMCTLSLPW